MDDITLTERASRRIGEILRREPPGSMLRVSVEGGGALAMLRQLAWLRLEPIFQHAVETVEVDVDDRRDIERQKLRQDEPADHGDADRLAQLGAGAGADRNR